MSVHAAKVLKGHQKASIILFCAHRWEALPFIAARELKILNDTPFPFSCYGEENSSLIVALTGQGKLRSAASTAAFLSHQTGPILTANFGTAGASKEHFEIGETVLINKVTDESSQRNFYPERLFRSPWKETACLTLDRVARKAGEVAQVYEMEAFGFCSAAEQYVASSDIVVAKFVSDHVSCQQPPELAAIRTELQADYAQACEPFLAFLEARSAAKKNAPRSLIEKSAQNWWLTMESDILESVSLTVTQQRQVRARLKAFALGSQGPTDLETKRSELQALMGLEKGLTKSDHTKTLELILRALATPPLFSSLS